MKSRRDVLKYAAAGTAGVLLPLSAARTEEAVAPRVGVRRSAERGHADHGWLDTRHSFSFASYRDPRWMGFRSLRVINEDRVHPTKGFPMHPHDNMEIVTYVLSGSLQHRDTLGNGSVIVPGEVQRMSAGTGIRHSEFNPSARDPVHFLQIWIVPDRRGVAPSYDQKAFSRADRTDTLKLVASSDGRDGSLRLHQDASLRAGILRPDHPVAWRNPRGRHVWIQVARGQLRVNDFDLEPGDGAWTSDPGDLALRPHAESEILLFDLA